MKEKYYVAYAIERLIDNPLPYNPLYVSFGIIFVSTFIWFLIGYMTVFDRELNTINFLLLPLIITTLDVLWQLAYKQLKCLTLPKEHYLTEADISIAELDIFYNKISMIRIKSLIINSLLFIIIYYFRQSSLNNIFVAYCFSFFAMEIIGRLHVILVQKIKAPRVRQNIIFTEQHPANKIDDCLNSWFYDQTKAIYTPYPYRKY